MPCVRHSRPGARRCSIERPLVAARAASSVGAPHADQAGHASEGASPQPRAAGDRADQPFSFEKQWWPCAVLETYGARPGARGSHSPMKGRAACDHHRRACMHAAGLLEGGSYF